VSTVKIANLLKILIIIIGFDLFSDGQYCTVLGAVKDYKSKNAVISTLSIYLYKKTLQMMR